MKKDRKNSLGCQDSFYINKLAEATQKANSTLQPLTFKHHSIFQGKEQSGALRWRFMFFGGGGGEADVCPKRLPF